MATTYSKPTRKPPERQYAPPQSALKIVGVAFIRTQPELKTFGETSVCEFLVGFGQAPDKDGNGGSGSLSVKAFNKEAIFIAGNVEKDSKVYIEARPQVETWQDKKTGEKRTKFTAKLDLLLPLSEPRESEYEEG